MTKTSSASEGKKISEKKSENGCTCCCAPVRDDTSIAVSRTDKGYLDGLAKKAGLSVKEVLAEIINNNRGALA